MFAVMPLERSVPSTAEVSGARIEGRIGAIQCTVLMPRLSEKGWKVQPPTDHEEWSQVGLWWGGGGAGIEGRHISVKALGLDFPSIQAEDDAALRLKDKIRAEGYRWLERVTDWLAVEHGEPAMSIWIEAPVAFLEFDPDVDPLDWGDVA